MTFTYEFTDQEVAAIEDMTKWRPAMMGQPETYETLVRQLVSNWTADLVRQYQERQMKAVLASAASLSLEDQTQMLAWLASRQPQAAETLGKVVGVEVPVVVEPTPVDPANPPVDPSVDPPASVELGQ